MIVGVISLILGFVNDISIPHGPSLLFNTYFFLGISMFAVFFMLLYNTLLKLHGLLS